MIDPSIVDGGIGALGGGGGAWGVVGGHAEIKGKS